MTFRICPGCRAKYPLANFENIGVPLAFKHFLCKCGYEGYLYAESEWPHVYARVLRGQMRLAQDFAEAADIRRDPRAREYRKEASLRYDQILALGPVSI